MQDGLGVEGRRMTFQIGVQIGDTFIPRTGNGLVRGVNDPVKSPGFERLQGNHGLDGGTVGIGDDSVMFLCCLWIDFGNHKWNAGIHAPRTGVVDDDHAMR